MYFGSDTTAPAHPRVIEALARVNTGIEPSYGDDSGSARARAELARTFETDDFDFWFVASGTAANALVLSCFCPPHASILCHREAHIQMDERGAPEFFTGGGRLQLLSGQGAKIDFAAFRDYLDGVDPGSVHATPPAALSLTNLTESGCAYTPDEIARFASRARGAGLAVHFDGARLGNALVHTGASPAQMTWKAGVDALSLGLTKTGAMGCEIIMLFGRARAKFQELRIRAKRSGHMPAKMRYLSAQAEAMLTGDLWLSLSAEANRKARDLAGVFVGLGVELAHPVEGNEVFVRLTDEDSRALKEDGARFYGWPDGSSRFVCSWATTDAEIADLRSTLGRAMRR